MSAAVDWIERTRFSNTWTAQQSSRRSITTPIAYSAFSFFVLSPSQFFFFFSSSTSAVVVASLCHNVDPLTDVSSAWPLAPFHQILTALWIHVQSAAIVRSLYNRTALFKKETKMTYEISPKAAKASRSVCVSISGLRSPTKMWKCSAIKTKKMNKTHDYWMVHLKQNQTTQSYRLCVAPRQKKTYQGVRFFFGGAHTTSPGK